MGPELNTKKAKVAWRDICKPKEEGGLGIRSLKEANNVSCLKLIWRIVSTNSLWVQWLQHYLIRKESFWSVKESSLGSWMWRKVIKYRTHARDFVRIDVRGGDSAFFWHDNWCSLGNLLAVTGHRGCIDLGIRLNSTVAEAVRTHRRRHHRIEDLNKIEEQIEIIRAKLLPGQEDIALWKGKGDSYKAKFGSKETWNAIREVQPQKSWYKGIWFSKSTPKYSILAWLAVLNRLSTGDRMVRWSTTPNTACVLCRHHMENRDHLFFECPYTKEVWMILVKKLLGQKFVFTWNEVLDTLTDDSLDAPVLFLVRYAFQISIHTIWRERNGRRHGEQPTMPTPIAKRIEKGIRNRISTIRNDAHGRYASYMEVWLGAR